MAFSVLGAGPELHEALTALRSESLVPCSTGTVVFEELSDRTLGIDSLCPS
jgi:hypothetical protein